MPHIPSHDMDGSELSHEWMIESGRSIKNGWSGLERLGLRLKVTAYFLCVEPWCDFVSPLGFLGDFEVNLAPAGIAASSEGEQFAFPDIDFRQVDSHGRS